MNRKRQKKSKKNSKYSTAYRVSFEAMYTNKREKEDEYPSPAPPPHNLKWFWPNFWVVPFVRQGDAKPWSYLT
jgi:hypothetical protein